ncbi:MAG: hypothetical protein MMC23_009706 [Stictis urceolatum]|nr:hypothetical protein [Stictis urceolata]
MNSQASNSDSRTGYNDEWQATLKEMRPSPDAAQSSKKAWERDIEEVTDSLPPPSMWNVPASAELIKAVVMHPPEEVRGEGHESQGSHEVLLLATRRFSHTMALCKVDLDPRTGDMMERRIASFRELVFASVCIVLLDCRVAEEDVNSIMRTALASSSGDRNIRRMRNGAQWVHRAIRTLIMNGWGAKASEAIFMFNRGIKFYARVTESGTSLEHLINCFPEPEQHKPASDRHVLLLPAAVDRVLGGVVK